MPEELQVPRMVAVVTTIQPTTRAVDSLLNYLDDMSGTGGYAELIVIGDKKGPRKYDERATFYSFADQKKLPYELAKILPANSYSRKNLGYLAAMETGTATIYETDDDNAPMSHWDMRYPMLTAKTVRAGRWVNVYSHYTDEDVWPRGLPPLEADTLSELTTDGSFVMAPVQQGLAQYSPDVDAIWRLTQDREIWFNSTGSVLVPPGTWSPFNSQSTWWWFEAFELMYLPSYCSWRACDIIRAFITQRIMWERNQGILYVGPEVIQKRNEHDLYQDLIEEIPILMHAEEIVRVLEDVHVIPYLSNRSNVVDCYAALVREGFLPEKEMELVYTWMDDMTRLLRRSEKRFYEAQRELEEENA